MIFSEKILGWYAKNKRDLPWRATNDPYKIWLSEIILQQTRVAQGIPYYHKFINEFPTIQDLAAASEQQVLKLWQGLGYYSRARNLHATAKRVTEEYNGIFPEDYAELIRLKGIGDYTASAIASICFNKAEPVVDGNVYRLLSRFFGIDLPVNSSAGQKYFKQMARKVMDAENIRDYNQAVMEFGATQCTPSTPDCNSCPLAPGCYALSEHQVGRLPVKIKKNAVRNRYFDYLVPIDPEKKTRMVKRKDKDIWQNLYEFPLLESGSGLDPSELLPLCKDLLKLSDIEAVYQSGTGSIVHKLSHQHLHTRFWIVQTNEEFEEGIPIEKIDQFPVPVLIADFIKTFKNSYF